MGHSCYMLRNRVFAICTSLSLFVLSFPLDAATRYDGDGVLSVRQEYIRWRINRARYIPEREADRLSLTNSATGGHPDYDVAEDVDLPNDFGSTTNEWAAWGRTMQPLAPNALLSLSADRHVDDMVREDAFQHATPSGSPYYTAGDNSVTRAAVEGYVNGLTGYLENLALGYQIYAGSFPPFGRSADSVHDGLFVDATASSRGHRKAILNFSAREIGFGHELVQEYNRIGSNWYWTSDWDAQAFGLQGTNAFFTGTIFEDLDGNYAYDFGEGRGGVDVRLWGDDGEFYYYDVSGASGSFAVPLNGVEDGEEVSVELVNGSGSNLVLALPTGFVSLGDVELGVTQRLVIGWFTDPISARNVGFRDLFYQPIVANPVVTGGLVQVSVGGFGRSVYILESSTDLVDPSWVGVATNSSSGSVREMTDPVPLSAGVTRYYRVRHEED